MPGSTRASLASGSIEARPMHVARIIEDHGHVGALPGEAGSGAARQHSGSSSAASGQRGLYIGRIARIDHADRKLAIVRGVRGIERARAEIEANFAADDAFSRASSSRCAAKPSCSSGG